MKNVKGARSGAKAVAPQREAFTHHSKSQKEMRRRRDHYAEHYAARQRKKHYADYYAAKTLNALARLELYKRSLRNKELQLQKAQRIPNARLIKTAIERDARICKERKIRRNEIMAKSRGRGLRIRNTTWSMDSYIQCRS